MMALRHAVVTLIFVGLASCSAGMQSSAIPSKSMPSGNASSPLAVRYGTATLLLAADRENLPAGAIARVLAFGAYGSTPLFSFFVSVPQKPTIPVQILGITSDAQGRIYMSFTTFPSGATYNSGAVAIYNHVPPVGSTRNPDELMTPVGAAITQPTAPVSGQLLAVDSSGRIYAPQGITPSFPLLYVYPALSNGPTAPLGSPLASCALDISSVAIGPMQDIFEGCVIEADIWKPFVPNSNSNIGFWNSRYSAYVAWLVTTTSNGVVYAVEQSPFADHPEVVPRIDVLPPNPIGSPPDYVPPPALREIAGTNSRIGYPVAVAACEHGEIYLAQMPSTRFPHSIVGILEYGATSNGNVGPSRVLLAGDKTISAIGF